MSDYKQTRDAAGKVTSQYGQMLQNLDDDLVKRLRNTPNWMREGFHDWKDNVRTYDRAPFEAADRIEELQAKLAKAVCALHEIAGKKTYADDPWGIARTTLAELKGQDDE